MTPKLNSRVVATAIVVLAISSAFTAGMVPAPQSDLTIREQVIRNTQRISDMDRDIQAIKTWQLDHEREQAVSHNEVVGQVREMAVKVEEHEKLIWLIFGAIIVGTVGAVFGWITSRTETRRMKHDMNSRLNELLTERGKAEHAAGRREGIESRSE